MNVLAQVRRRLHQTVTQTSSRRGLISIGALAGALVLSGTLAVPAFADNSASAVANSAVTSPPEAPSSTTATASSAVSDEPTADRDSVVDTSKRETAADGEPVVVTLRTLSNKLEGNAYTLSYGDAEHTSHITMPHVLLSGNELDLVLEKWGIEGHSQDINMAIRIQQADTSEGIKYYTPEGKSFTNPVSGYSDPTIWHMVTSSTPNAKAGVPLPKDLSGSDHPGVQFTPISYESAGADVGHGVLTLAAKPYITDIAPKPLIIEDLKDGLNNLAINTGDKNIRIKLPESQKRQWYYFSLYLNDTSRRKPWGDQWFRADEKGWVRLPLEGQLPRDRVQLVAQSRVSQDGTPAFFGPADAAPVAGWTYYTFPVTPESSAPGTAAPAEEPSAADELRRKFEEALPNWTKTTESTSTAPSSDSEPDTTRTLTSTRPSAPAGEGNTVTIIRRTAGGGGSVSGPRIMPHNNAPGLTVKPQPKDTPKAPVESAADLTAIKSGKVRASHHENSMTVTVPDREPGEWVYVYAYTPKPEGLGWVSLNEKKEFTIDTSGLPEGYHKLAILGSNTDLLGWVGVTVKEGADGAGAGSSGGPGTVLISRNNPTMTGSDWAWIFGSLALLQALILAVAWLRGRRKLSQPSS